MDEQNLGDPLKENQEVQEEEEGHNRDRFTDFMFGNRKAHHQSFDQQQDVNPSQNYIDYEQLMFHIDSLIESTKDFKPLLKKFRPFLEQFWNKK